MRVNIYAEEMTDRIQIISKNIDGQEFTGLRFYLELPVTTYKPVGNAHDGDVPYQIRGPFIHHLGDDDSAAVTFWGKQDLRKILSQALLMLNEHYTLQEQKCPKPQP